MKDSDAGTKTIPKRLVSIKRDGIERGTIKQRHWHKFTSAALKKPKMAVVTQLRSGDPSARNTVINVYDAAKRKSSPLIMLSQSSKAGPVTYQIYSPFANHVIVARGLILLIIASDRRMV